MRRQLSSLPFETPSAKRIHELIQPKVPLSYWDTITLRYLLQWLDTNHVLLLLRIGNRLLASKLHSQIMSLHYTEDNLKPVTTLFSPPVYNCPWPFLLSNPSPLLRLTTLRVEGIKSMVRGDLSALPPTLTKLLLIDVYLGVRSLKCLRFCLPNLYHLRFQDVTARIIMNGNWTNLACTWLSVALCDSPALHTFRYGPPTEYYVPLTLGLFDLVRACINVLPMLEKLSLPYFDYQINQWPAGLHTLALYCYGIESLTRNTGELMIPPSVKTLIIHHPPNADVTRRILQCAPTSLTCLEANLLDGYVNAAIMEIARFTQLQSLHMPRNVDLAEINLYEKCDLSHLPQSVTAVSESFAIQPSSWQYIPRKARLMNRKPNDSTKPAYATATCLYEDCQDEDYIPHFPNDLTRIHLIDSNVPVANNNIQWVSMDISRVDAFSRLECATVFTNMSRTLTSLTILMVCAPSLIWLDGFDEMSESACERFPCLKSLSLEVRSHLSRDQNVCAWLSHLPPSLQRLHLNVQAPMKSTPIEFASITFPPNLITLKLHLIGYLIDMPRTLPLDLVKVELLWFNIIDATSYEHVASWPTSLRKVSIFAWGEMKPHEQLALALDKLTRRTGRQSLLAAPKAI